MINARFPTWNLLSLIVSHNCVSFSVTWDGALHTHHLECTNYENGVLFTTQKLYCHTQNVLGLNCFSSVQFSFVVISSRYDSQSLIIFHLISVIFTAGLLRDVSRQISWACPGILWCCKQTEWATWPALYDHGLKSILSFSVLKFVHHQRK